MTAYTPRQRRVLLSIINQLEEPMAKDKTSGDFQSQASDAAHGRAAADRMANGGTAVEGKPRQQTAPNPEFQLLARIDRMLSRVPPEVANRILSMLAAQRMGMSLTIAAKPCNSVPLG